jgi:hypothetical protein
MPSVPEPLNASGTVSVPLSMASLEAGWPADYPRLVQTVAAKPKRFGPVFLFLIGPVTGWGALPELGWLVSLLGVGWFLSQATVYRVMVTKGGAQLTVLETRSVAADRKLSHWRCGRFLGLP